MRKSLYHFLLTTNLSLHNPLLFCLLTPSPSLPLPPSPSPSLSLPIYSHPKLTLPFLDKTVCPKRWIKRSSRIIFSHPNCTESSAVLPEPSFLSYTLLQAVGQAQYLLSPWWDLLSKYCLQKKPLWKTIVHKLANCLLAFETSPRHTNAKIAIQKKLLLKQQHTLFVENVSCVSIQ